MYLEIKNVTKIINKNTILDHINLTMDRGKIYGLRGKNGSGKTMLLRAICGLIRLNEGEVIIDGKPLGKQQEFPPSVGALIENPGFIENYSGYRNLMDLAEIQKQIGPDEITNALKIVGLDPQDKKKVKAYSLGMRQKLGIAAAIMEHPDLVILDEPTNALDEESVKKLHQILLKEKERNALVIVASHDIEELNSLCDEVVFVDGGRIKKERKEHEEDS